MQIIVILDMPSSVCTVLLAAILTIIHAGQVEGFQFRQLSSNDLRTRSLPRYQDKSMDSFFIDQLMGETFFPNTVRIESGDEHGCHIENRKADCRHRDLHEIPQNLSRNIIELDLSYNILTAIGDRAFSIYPQLQEIDLRHNNISQLSENSFFNLSALLSLDLHDNFLAMDHMRFPDEVFCPLISLRVLKMNKNTFDLKKPDLGYPDKALSCLHNLEALHMDGLPSYHTGKFGEGFRNLTKLRNLTLAGYTTGNCAIVYLPNNTFENLVTLEHLDLSDCRIKGTEIQAGAFCPLKLLRSLNLNHNEEIDIAYLDTIFYGLQGAKNLTHLEIQLIVNRYSVGVCLESSFVKNIPQSLTHLDAGQNNIEAIDVHVIDQLPPNLKVLDLNGNHFVFGAYLLNLSKMNKLERLYLNSEDFNYRIPKLYPYRHGDQSYIPINSNCSLYFESGKRFVLQLPPNLKYIEMKDAGLRYILSELKVNDSNSLESLNLHGNHFSYLEGPIYGLHSLRYLDISGSYVSEISEKFFQNLTALTHLDLGANLLSNSIKETAFATLTKLQVLDLSLNDISSLPSKVFLPLCKLTKLNLSQNPLSSFSITISQMHSLKILNLSRTPIAGLPLEARDHIDTLPGNITVDMKFTPISCDCSNLDFLKWMVASPAFKSDFEHYSCVYSESSRTHISDGYNSTIEILARQCSSNQLLFFITGSATTVMFSFIIGAILYRFRWNFRYMYYAAYLSYSKHPNRKEKEFEFDAFICYADEDMEFAERIMDRELTHRGLKICLHRRDFTPGEFITCNIVKAVCCSKRTVVVLTRSLTESSWCAYEIEMAKMEGLYTGRQVLIFVIMEKIPKRELGKALLYSISKNTYQKYPDTNVQSDQLKLWWNKLARDIKA